MTSCFLRENYFIFYSCALLILMPSKMKCNEMNVAKLFIVDAVNICWMTVSQVCAVTKCLHHSHVCLITLSHFTMASTRKMKDDEEEKAKPALNNWKNMCFFDIALTRHDVIDVSLLVELLFHIATDNSLHMIKKHKNQWKNERLESISVHTDMMPLSISLDSVAFSEYLPLLFHVIDPQRHTNCLIFLQHCIFTASPQ